MWSARELSFPVVDSRVLPSVFEASLQCGRTDSIISLASSINLMIAFPISESGSIYGLCELVNALKTRDIRRPANELSGTPTQSLFEPSERDRAIEHPRLICKSGHAPSENIDHILRLTSGSLGNILHSIKRSDYSFKIRPIIISNILDFFRRNRNA